MKNSIVKNVGIVIGVARAGTTWLNSQLELQREVFADPVKEVRHFIGSPKEEARRNRRKLVEERMGESCDSVATRWLAFWEVADSNSVQDYRKLMLEIPDRPVSIDVSPIYCTAVLEKVKLFKESVGRACILMVLRNPVDCSYSLASRLLHSARGRTQPNAPVDQLNLEGWMALFSKPRFRKRMDFLGAIRDWRTVFEADALRVEFFESIQSDPAGVVRGAVEHFWGKLSPRRPICVISQSSDFVSY